jgi:hypothetical protein
MDKFLKTKKDNIFDKCDPGKLFLVKGWSTAQICNVLGVSAVYVGTDTLRSQSITENFFEFIEFSKADIVMDDSSMIKNELPGWRWIQKNRFNIHSRIFIPCENNIDTIQIQDKTIEPENKKEIIETLHQRDLFKTTKEIMEDILTTKGDFKVNDYLGMHMDEPGNRMGIVQENYVHAKGITMDEISKIADHLVEGDYWDTVMYSSMYNEQIHEQFLLSAVINPCAIIQNRIPVNKMAAARVWTKDFNMRLKKSLEKDWVVSDPDTMHLLRIKPEFIPMYCKKSKSIHFINQTSMGIKIKNDVLKNIKDVLKEREQDFL